MYYDHAEAAYENNCKNEYEKLKENLKKSKNSDDEMLLKHLRKLERELLEAKAKVDDFHKFFEMLQRMLPKQHSIHDTIG